MKSSCRTRSQATFRFFARFRVEESGFAEDDAGTIAQPECEQVTGSDRSVILLAGGQPAIALADAPDSMQRVVRAADETIFDETITPDYEVSYPNGPDCGSCRSASQICALVTRSVVTVGNRPALARLPAGGAASSAGLEPGEHVVDPRVLPDASFFALRCALGIEQRHLARRVDCSDAEGPAPACGVAEHARPARLGKAQWQRAALDLYA
jgi:hypothetical protein